MNEKKIIDRITIYYVAELNLPSRSAYSIHVMKMCEAFAKKKIVKLFLISCQNQNIIKNNYNIKNDFNIFAIFKKEKKLNFFTFFIYTLKILIKKLDKNYIFISRSIIFALIASILSKKVILELHHEITGFSKILYFICKYLGLLKNLNYIFLNNQLNKIYNVSNNKFIVLDDAVDIDDFNINKKNKYKNTCVYIGSFFEGKGIEQIFRLAKYNNKINFHIYGEKKFLKKNVPLIKNIKIFNYVNYKEIPKVLANYEIALMPYQKKVKGRTSINIEKYMSPLKMFDYLASKMVIIASDMKIYKHILKNNYNCMLVEVNNDKKWSEVIKKILKNTYKKKLIMKNAYKTAINYTWEKRCKKIIDNFIKYSN